MIAPLEKTGHVFEQLTRREREAAELVAAGKTDKQVAEAMGISRPGVWFHLREIATKWGLQGNVRVLIALRVRERSDRAA
jgi:DNA-binding CsgD family transcriptional regulator